ncbi:MAG: DUF4258 domain-containing protein [Thermomicrobiales bacterium]
MQFDGIQIGVHARGRLELRNLSVQDIEVVLANPERVYPGSTPGTTVVEGATEAGRRIAVVYSDVVDSRRRIAYIVTVYPVRRRLQ